MKTLIASLLLLSSFQVLAFEKITLLRDVKLQKLSFSDRHTGYADSHSSSGNDYCNLSISTRSPEESITIPAGTAFQVDQKWVFNGCVNDWGKQCRLNLTANNVEQDLSFQLVCKDRGVFASLLTIKKINKLGAGLIHAE